MTSSFWRFALPAVLLTTLAVWKLASAAQQSGDDKAAFPLAKTGSRFEFEIVESFDAKYLGDTPGHTGQAGGLGVTRPSVALGDHVFRGKDIVGTVTSVVWSRARGSLTIEFDPKPLLRISVGDVVAVDLNPASPPKGAE